jgi:hypothetical protein
MSFFPQLSTGVMSQFPMQRRQQFRTIVNRLSDGSQIKSLDPFGAALAFALQFKGLSDEEMDGIEAFFLAQEGRRGSFGFLDPAFNLLRWSEDFTRSVWTTGPLLAISGGQEDPWGGQRATSVTNSAIAPQAVIQVIDAPGGYSYCFSVWLRGLSTEPVTLLAASGGYTQSQAVWPTAEWKRFHLSVSLPSEASSIGFGWELPPGATIHAVGAQTDAQPAPAAYRRTSTRHGVHPKVRFAMDSLARTTSGPNDHSTTVSLLTRAV